MPRASWSSAVSRKIVQRIVVEGNLVLQTPAHLGNGDGNNLIDMLLLTDSVDSNMPLLTGASIAGALRGYLREREHGFRAKVLRSDSASVLLFGGGRGDAYGEQSPLIVEDARGKDAAIELRDGVGIAGKSYTADHDKLFNIEMWEAGTTFPLRFELIVRERDDPFKLRRALATALTGFNDGSITIGARKRRGYGQVSVTGWRVKEYDLVHTAGLLDWIENGTQEMSGVASQDIIQALAINEMIADRRQTLRLRGEFYLDGSLLIRSGSGPDIEQADVNDAAVQRPEFLHLHSTRATPLSGGARQRAPILSGTSLAGALRARAFKIARLIAPPADQKAASDLIDGMFGADMETTDKPAASRVLVYEHVVRGVENMFVQNRVSIDRFTGGTRDGALFDEQPLFGGAQSLVTVELQLAQPQEHEIGLLLLLLKDLWTGDLPLGGETAIGRGRLRGKSCHLEYRNDQVRTWDLFANGVSGLSVTAGERQELENFVARLHTHLGGSKV